MLNLAKNLLRAGVGKDAKTIDKFVTDFNGIVSFDMYDTLIYRNCCSPTDVFKMVERTFKERYEDEYSGFAKLREEAEKKARRNKNEVSLDEIYYEFEETDENTLCCLKNIEKELEISVSVANPEMYFVYERCKDLGKRVIITTDMYLSHGVLEQVLQKCGVTHYSDLYISSEENCSKRTGELFRTICKREKCDADMILHIGDNIISDFLVPKSIGINTLLYKK